MSCTNSTAIRFWIPSCCPDSSDTITPAIFTLCCPDEVSERTIGDDVKRGGGRYQEGDLQRGIGAGRDHNMYVTTVRSFYGAALSNSSLLTGHDHNALLCLANVEVVQMQQRVLLGVVPIQHRRRA